MKMTQKKKVTTGKAGWMTPIKKQHNSLIVQYWDTINAYYRCNDEKRSIKLYEEAERLFDEVQRQSNK